MTKNLLKECEQYYTSKGIIHVAIGLILGGTGIVIEEFFIPFLGYLILGFGILLVLRGLVEIFQDRDIFSWVNILIKKIYLKIKIKLAIKKQSKKK